jgi:2'-5' RNA ligase
MNQQTPQHADAPQWRLFCAVELSTEVRERAAAHIARLREKLPDLRAGWERTDKLHVTLKFFGDVEHSRIEALSIAISRAADTIAPFKLDIAAAGTFPPHGNPRVLWLGIRDSSGSLARLHNSLENECAAAGFKREQRPFHPHITLARLRQPAAARPLADLHRELGFKPLELPVNEILLMRSELGPGGSRYEALSRHRLSI